MEEQRVAEAQRRVERIGRRVVAPTAEPPVGRYRMAYHLPVRGCCRALVASLLLDRASSPGCFSEEANAATYARWRTQRLQVSLLRRDLLAHDGPDEASGTRLNAEKGILSAPEPHVAIRCSDGLAVEAPASGQEAHLYTTL
jgi:hypothetical protein